MLGLIKYLMMLSGYQVNKKKTPKRTMSLNQFNRKDNAMGIQVEKLNEQAIKDKGINGWPIWEKEVSRFDWSYGDTEECYLLEGDVEVETPDGKRVRFGKGDFVTFAKGLSCVWDIKKPVRKHYNFK
jgi:hypothetical protein